MTNSPHGRRRPTRGLSAALAALAALALSACGTSHAGTGDASTTVLRYQGSVGQVGYPELAADLGYFEHVTLDWVGDVTGGPASIQAVATGETEFGSAFNGAIIKLRDSGARITSVLSSYGSDDETFSGFFVLEDSPIHTARDLIGKKVAINTLGAQHEAVTRSWLKHEGLTPDEIAQVELTVVPPVNSEQVLREGQVDVANLSFVLKEKALERGGLRQLFSETDLFGTFSYGTYVLRDDFIADNPEATKDFVQGTARAIRWAQTTPVETVRERFTTIIENRGRNETTDLIPHYRSTGIAGAGGVTTDEEISTWIDWLVADGQITPGITPADVYTNEFNPYANGTFPADSDADGKPVDNS